RLIAPCKSGPLGARVSLWRLSSVHLRLVDQSLQSRVDGFFAGGADPFVPDHAPGIEDVVARRAGVPFGVDRILMRERPPVHFLLVHSLLEVLGLVVVDVDADQGERLAFQFRYERPLVAPTGPSDQYDV